MNQIGDEGIPHLHSFPQLKKLYLWTCDISAKGVEALSKLSFSPQLQILVLGRIVDNLDSNNIGDEGISHLNKFSSLTELCLYQCGIGYKGVESLSEMHFPKLQTLDLRKIMKY